MSISDDELGQCGMERGQVKKQETHMGPQPAKATTLEMEVARDFPASVLGKNQVPVTGESTSRSLADPQETCCVQWAELRCCEKKGNGVKSEGPDLVLKTHHDTKQA